MWATIDAERHPKNNCGWWARALFLFVIISTVASTAPPAVMPEFLQLLPSSPFMLHIHHGRPGWYVMGRASQVLAQSVPPGVPQPYRTLADHGEVPCSTLRHRARGRRSMEEKAQSQQYLTPWEEEAFIKFLLQMSDLGHPVLIKFMPSIAYHLTLQRPQSARPPKPPYPNWSRKFEKRHSVI